MNRKNQKGMALPLVLIFSAFLIFLGSSLLKTEVSEVFFRINDEDQMQAYYLARAGAEAIFDVFTNDPETGLVLLDDNKKTATATAFGEGTIEVEVTDNRTVQVNGHNKNEILITSTGRVGRAEDTVILDLDFSPAATGYNVFQYPMYSEGSFSIGPASLDFGGAVDMIATGLTSHSDYTLNNGSLTSDDIQLNVSGEDYLTPLFPIATEVASLDMNNSNDLMTIVKEGNPASEHFGETRITVEYAVASNPNFDSGWIDGAIKIPTFDGNSGRIEVYIPINESLKIVSDDFSTSIPMQIISTNPDGTLWEHTYPMDDNGTPSDPSDDTLDFEALETYEGDLDGVMELYITTNLDFSTNAAVLATTPNSFFAILDTGATFDFGANGEFNGYIYAPDADVNILSAGTTFYGAVIAEHITLGGNADYIFFPFFMTDIPMGFINSADYGVTIDSWR